MGAGWGHWGCAVVVVLVVGVTRGREREGGGGVEGRSATVPCGAQPNHPCNLQAQRNSTETHQVLKHDEWGKCEIYNGLSEMYLSFRFTSRTTPNSLKLSQCRALHGCYRGLVLIRHASLQLTTYQRISLIINKNINLAIAI